MKSKFLHKIRTKLKSVFNRLYLLISNNERKVIVSQHEGVPGLKLHLGAGPINLAGWINIDAREAPHIHLITNNFELVEFADESLSEIYLCHVLEHFSFEESKLLLNNFRRKLKSGGVFRVSVPDIDHLISAYKANGDDLELVKMAFMGGQDYEYNFHKSIYNSTLLSKLFIECGFKNPEKWITESDFGVNLGDWSNKSFDTPAGLFPVSLNIKGYVTRN
ncbi:class I SAM-dependent methyltransferase [Lentilitoribacter sp. EG35]|uniref:class I SAM-dependent methyltransferase n=1 Tax=Lentilitoribacter sp. EG35 TaxID=3234192 RepID=UPI003460FD0F